MKKFRHVTLFTVGMCLIAQMSWATKAYVTDSFRISLRRGPSLENKILKFISSGRPVEILESRDGWSYVYLIEPEQSGLKGWVLSRYLINRLPWEEEAKSLRSAKDQLKEKLNRVNKDWEKALKKETAGFSKLKAAYAIAQDTVLALTEENKGLRSSQKNRWFAIGALVLLCGLMIGLLIGRQQKKHRSSPYL